MKQCKLFPASLQCGPAAYGQPTYSIVMEVLLSLSTLPSAAHEAPSKKVLYPLAELWPQVHLFLTKIPRNKK